MKFIVDAVFPPRETELYVRACSNESLCAVLSPVRLPVETYPAVGLLPYVHKSVQACIIEAKFHTNARATALLGHVLHKYLLEFITRTREFPQEKIIFVPIPLSRSRLRERGYNQSERIAHSALKGMEGKISLESDLLVRTRDTLPQTSLGGDARRQNILDAFAASRPCNPAYTYIVFDDVMTTGSTLHAAVLALTNADARYVFPLALAH